MASAINSQTGATGLTATFNGNNELVLTGNLNELKISNFEYKGDAVVDPAILVVNPSDGTTKESIAEKDLQSEIIRSKISDSFEHFATKRAEVSAARRAQSAEVSAQDILLVLEEDISEIKDADLATILTQLEFLMTQKDAAQATFTRVTSKSLFDFLS